MVVKAIAAIFLVKRGFRETWGLSPPLSAIVRITSKHAVIWTLLLLFSVVTLFIYITIINRGQDLRSGGYVFTFGSLPLEVANSIRLERRGM
jgi:hypothetical protein